jgi:hypothetical protein
LIYPSKQKAGYTLYSFESGFYTVMNNSTSAKIISTSIGDNSFEIANITKTKQNDRTAISTNSKTQSFELLMYEVDNFQDYSDRICQNWLKAHKTESLCSKNIQQYTKIVILLQDIIEWRCWIEV